MARDIDRIRRELVRQGWRIEARKGGHDLAFPPDPSKPPVTLSGTPSGSRWLPNLIAELRRSGFRWEGR